MDDIISRRQAIYVCLELMHERRKWLSDAGQKEINGIDAAMCAIRNLPSAQPTCNQLATDCISRQAAINAVADGLKHTFVENQDIAEKLISKLPSAQPDVPDINVGDMISRQAVVSICDNAIDLWNGQLGAGAIIAVRDAIKALPSTDAVPVEWIKDEIDWLKGSDNVFAKLSAGQLEAMLKRWKDGDHHEG